MPESAPVTEFPTNPKNSPAEKPVKSLPTDPKAPTKAKSQKTKKSRLTPGARNLILLGIGSTLIALVTTTIGLAIYHVSGDIYLDRSRPGYLPEEAEAEEEAETAPEEFNFEKSGKIDRATLEEYLKHLTEELNAVDSYKDPFTEAPLSDDRLGIPKDN